MVFSKDRVLVLAPHTDDGEFGCGGAIAKLNENGSEVHYIAFSSCQISVPEGFPDDILIKEVKEATEVLGVGRKNLHIFDFPVRRFSHYRQEILEELVKFQQELLPDILFMPSCNDLHQDHSTVAMEGLRAFKQTTILSYEIPWNNMNFATQGFIKFDERHMKTKLEALKKYKSQMNRPYANEECIRGLAKARGVSSGGQYAEAFEVVRLSL